VERVTGIGGVFIRSAQHEALRAWYAEHLGLELQEFGGAVLRSDGGETLVWSVFPGETDYFGSREQQAMVNYRVRDLDAMLAQLRASGVPVDDHVEEMEHGRFGWATDPDGNRLELWEPAPGH
jgi:predicted enzyme related to lactoylglutathione lyase